jgi:CheY-like chemotaxis protein
MDVSPILIVDDDQDDLDLIKEVSDRLCLNRPIHLFKNGNELISYLNKDVPTPFIIICDVNLPNEDGFALKKRITEIAELKYKSVPFIYWSNGASQKQIQNAYDLPAQGFFLKPNNFEDLCKGFKTIIDYWEQSQHPKKVQ